VFPVRYKLNFYINLLRNSLFKGLNLKFTMNPHFVEVTDDLIKQAQTLQSLLVDIIFIIELLVIRDGCKHNSDTTVPLMVQLLRTHIPQVKLSQCCTMNESPIT
jgi:hypothetical protein